MARLGDLVQKVRSKNAGPFWLTLDVFCGTDAVFTNLVSGVKTQEVADLFQVDVAQLKRFDMPDLNVVKFSLPRPHVQGVLSDRDMHGASYASLLSDLDI